MTVLKRVLTHLSRVRRLTRWEAEQDDDERHPGDGDYTGRHEPPSQGKRARDEFASAGGDPQEYRSGIRGV